MHEIDHKSRAHALLSASSAERWLACPGSAVAASIYPSVDTVFTQEGTRAHELAERVARAWLEGAELELPENTDAEMLRHAEGYRDFVAEHTPPGAKVLLEQRVDFSQWVPQGFGTADCLIVAGSELLVIDFKYGAGVAVSAEHNPQMRLYALGAYALLSPFFEFDRITTYIYQPRMDNVSSEQLTTAEALQWASDVVAPAAADAYSEQPSHAAGVHCRWCQHAGRCRVLAQHCSAAVDMADGSQRRVERLAPWEVADLLQLEPVLTAWLKAVKAQALTDALNGDEIPGYKVVEGRAGVRKWRDADELAEVMAARGYGPDVYTKRELLSPTELDKVLGKKDAAQLVGHLVTRSAGSPSLVPVTDKRPPYDRSKAAAADFN